MDLNVSMNHRPRSAGGDGRPGFTVERSALTQCDTHQLGVVQCGAARAVLITSTWCPWGCGGLVWAPLGTPSSHLNNDEPL